VTELIKAKIIPRRQMFYSDTSNYGIYSCETNEKSIQLNNWGNFSIKGNLPRLMIDTEYDVTLEGKMDQRYGLSYEVHSIYQEMPTSRDMQKIYLQSILTDKQVKEIFKAYPEGDIIQLFKNDEIDITKVKGLGKKNYLKVKDKIIENLELQEALVYLSKYNISNKIILRLVQHFKSAKLLIQKLEENPYSMLAVKGIGFLKADAIALNMGYDRRGEFRIKSAIEYVIEEEQSNGHTYIAYDNLMAITKELLNIETELIKEQITDTDNVLVLGERVTLRKLYNAEKYVANRLKEILNDSSELNFNVDQFISKQEQIHNIKLTDQQRSFFHNIKKYNVNFLVGYAGCGKSQLQKFLIELLDQLGVTYKLLAPTGKAAKVLSKYTNRDASTIHRAIGLGEKEEDGIPREIIEQFVIVDETSMLDVQLASVLLKRCSHPNVRLLFIGDDFQIPSVNCGNFLHDSIQSNMLPVTKLDIVFRQKEGGILDVVTKIRKGEKFIDNSFWGIKEFGDNVILASVPQEKMEGGYQYYYKESLNDYRQEDVMVLSPTKKGDLGTFGVNRILQSIVNPKSEDMKEIQMGKDTHYREKDMVINIKNTYKILNMDEQDVDIVNGDTGKILAINEEDKEVIIDFEFDHIPIPFKLLENILHSWCITMHKSQGSSAKTIISISDKAHKYQLNANLLYTAWTRSEEKLIILCQADVINYAMRKVVNLQRNTFLKELLMKE
jgi:exodeoxyribonuclease V alpha subunit